jgi:hypothetical protein
MHGNPETFLQNVAPGLGVFYIALTLMNAVAALYVWRQLNRVNLAIGLSVFSAFLAMIAAAAMGGVVPQLPAAFKSVVNDLSGPVTYSLGTTLLLVVLFLGRRFFVKPLVAWTMLNASLLLMGLSMADSNFFSIVGKPDNVPIVAMIYLVGYFTWLATYRAVINDDRDAQGLPPVEATEPEKEKVLVWPDLVYTELICMVGLTALLMVWAILLQAPLEESASAVKTPNPSKAPWYFLGLQEMLVYYDPWWAGVVLPSMVVFGLMAIPFLDYNKKGNGYYTISQRPFSYLVFQIGFLELWITLIVLGTFLRGPNWNFFGPYEFWDSHKVEALNNINLSDIFWIKLMGQGLPTAPSDAGAVGKITTILLREWLGIVIVIGYLVLLPPLMAATVFRNMFVKMGFIRYMLMSNLLLLMIALPLKMVLRWSFNLKYIISIPEYFLNF